MINRSSNAQLAVELYNKLNEQYHWSADSAWHGIARLLLTCDIWSRRWEPFHDVVVYRETNDFSLGTNRQPNAVLRRAETLTSFLADQLGVDRKDLCREIGLYWREASILPLQPHNPVGHAFRSLVVTILEKFGSQDVRYEEEVDPHKEFPGFEFSTRSKKPRIDIVARRGSKTVALMSTRWRYRHDRVDVVEEALAYGGAARRHNPKCQLFAVIGEFAPNRLDKILSNCAPAHPHPPLTAAVHFAPVLISKGLGENGRLSALRDLAWLASQSYDW